MEKERVRNSLSEEVTIQQKSGFNEGASFVKIWRLSVLSRRINNTCHVCQSYQISLSDVKHTSFNPSNIKHVN